MSHGSTAPAGGNAVTPWARAQGAGKAIATTTNPATAAQARALGVDEVIDLSAARLADGVARLTGGRGVDGVIESVGGALTGQALATLALHGVLTSLGYSAGRQTTIDVTDLIWKRASMPATMREILSKSLTLRSFISNEFAAEHYPAFLHEVGAGIADGRIRYREDIVNGLEKAPEAFIGMLDGHNFGKVIVRMAA